MGRSLKTARGNRPRSRFLYISFTASLLFGASGLACGGSNDLPIRTVRIYELLPAFPQAVVRVPPVDFAAAAVRPATIDGVSRPALFLHPPSSVEYAMPVVGTDAVLTAALALDEAAWDKSGDGVEFTVSVKLPRDVVVKVYSRYIDPKNREEERRWIDVRVPLGPFAGQRIHVILGTSPGPHGDTAYDWAVWGAPRIVLDPM